MKFITLTSIKNSSYRCRSISTPWWNLSHWNTFFKSDNCLLIAPRVTLIGNKFNCCQFHILRATLNQRFRRIEWLQQRCSLKIHKKWNVKTTYLHSGKLNLMVSHYTVEFSNHPDENYGMKHFTLYNLEFCPNYLARSLKNNRNQKYEYSTVDPEPILNSWLRRGYVMNQITITMIRFEEPTLEKQFNSSYLRENFEAFTLIFIPDF